MTPQWFYKLETNISSIQVALTKQILSFWLKILETHVSEPLPFCYEALGKNDDQKTKTWTRELRKLLDNYPSIYLGEPQTSTKQTH